MNREIWDFTPEYLRKALGLSETVKIISAFTDQARHNVISFVVESEAAKIVVTGRPYPVMRLDDEWHV